MSPGCNPSGGANPDRSPEPPPPPVMLSAAKHLARRYPGSASDEILRLRLRLDAQEDRGHVRARALRIREPDTL